MVVTGTSIALWGSKVVRTDGSEFEGMGLLGSRSQRNEAVYGDDIYFSCSYHGAEMEIIGNQIQMADFINQGEEPFGKLIYGYGNTGKNREEGFQKECYLHQYSGANAGSQSETDHGNHQSGSRKQRSAN